MKPTPCPAKNTIDKYVELINKIGGKQAGQMT